LGWRELLEKRKIFIIIPAKGSSSRLPRKNICLLNGKPLLVFTIETAKEWGEADHIFLNSEDDEILRLASEHGAEIYKRPKELSGGNVLAIEVIKDQIRSQGIAEADIVILLQVTCPLREAKDIDNAYRIFTENEMVDQVVSVTEFEKPPELALYIDNENRLKRKFSKDFHLLTQKHAKAYKFNTCLVINTAGGFLKQIDSVGLHSVPYVMPPKRSIDIDHEYQLEIAEFLMKRREK